MSWRGSRSIQISSLILAGLALYSGCKLNIPLFGPTQYRLTVSVSPSDSGYVTRDPDRTYYEEGTSVHLEATGASGWQMDHWSGDLSGNSNSADLKMDGNRDITAVFTTMKQLKIFRFVTPEAEGMINEAAHTIGVVVPEGTSLAALVAVFECTGVQVKVGNSVQTSGTTVNDFTDPVIYTVVATDGSTQDYKVMVGPLPTIYAAGHVDHGQRASPCYWTGTERTDLVNNPYATANDIFVFEGTVFTAGSWRDLNWIEHPCYWTGTTRTDLGDGRGIGRVTSIFVSGNTVYCAGIWNSNPCYWTGTTRTDLSPRSSVVDSLFVYEGTVYTAGHRYDETKDIACYWMGTARTDLGDGHANDIFVDEGTVYTAGDWRDGAKTIPSYWTGTTRTDLGDGTHDSTAVSIFVSEGTVYTAGFWRAQTECACFWKGTLRNDLGNGTLDSRATTLFVSDGTVYTGGWQYTAGHPCYWTDTARTDLYDGEHAFQCPYSIFVSNGTVYFAGCLHHDVTNPCYWMWDKFSRVRVDLDVDSGYSAHTQSIVVSDGTVYTAGYWDDLHKFIPCYWTGATRTDLGDGSHSAYATSIVVSEGIVYIAGFWHDGTKSIPCYWTGTTRTDLGDGTRSAYVYSIYVSEGIVYTAGYREDGTKSIPCYWTGTTGTDLGDGTRSGSVSSIVVSGGTIYTAGHWDGNACCWTGILRTDLSGGCRAAFFVSDGTIYSAGRRYGYYDWDPTGLWTYIPCYWTGTTRTDCEPEIWGSDSHGTYNMSIFVWKGIVYMAGYSTSPADCETRACYWFGIHICPLGEPDTYATSLFVE